MLFSSESVQVTVAVVCVILLTWTEAGSGLKHVGISTIDKLSIYTLVPTTSCLTNAKRYVAGNSESIYSYSANVVVKPSIVPIVTKFAVSASPVTSPYVATSKYLSVIPGTDVVEETFAKNLTIAPPSLDITGVTIQSLFPGEVDVA